MHYSNTFEIIQFLKSCAWDPLKPILLFEPASACCTVGSYASLSVCPSVNFSLDINTYLRKYYSYRSETLLFAIAVILCHFVTYINRKSIRYIGKGLLLWQVGLIANVKLHFLLLRGHSGVQIQCLWPPDVPLIYKCGMTRMLRLTLIYYDQAVMNTEQCLSTNFVCNVGNSHCLQSMDLICGFVIF